MRIWGGAAVVVLLLSIAGPAPAGIAVDGTLVMDLEWLDGTQVDSWCVHGYGDSGGGTYDFVFGGADVPIEPTLDLDLAPGQYLIEAVDCSDRGFANTFYDGQPIIELANPVTIASETTTNLTMQVGANASLSGSVLDQVEAPILQLNVELWLPEATDWLDRVSVDESGAFSFGDLVAGSYLLHFDLGGPNPIDEWYAAAQDQASAAHLVVHAGEDTFVAAAFTTPRAGTVRMIMPDNLDIGYIDGCYDFYDDAGVLLDRWEGVTTGAVDFPYPEGQAVRVRFSQCGWPGDALHEYRWGGGGKRFDESTVYFAEAYTIITATMPGSSYDASDALGAVWGSASDLEDGEPMQATIEFHQVEGSGLISVQTDALDGFFEMLPLDEGGWKIIIIPSSSAYEPVWYPGVDDEDSAEPVTVGAGESVRVNFELTRLTGTVGGTVSLDGALALGATVELYDEGGLTDSATTDGNGEYTFDNVSYGTYFVKASSYGYFSEWYDAAPGVRMDLATSVEVSTNSTSGIDLSLEATFSDTEGSLFEDEITWLVEAGITLGCGDGQFCPNDLVSRAQMGSFIARALGLGPIPGDVFGDVSGVHEPNINAIAAAEITVGCNTDGSQFCPGTLIDRAQIATFLTRGLEYPISTTDYFIDDNGLVHEPNINALREQEVTLGCGLNLYCPGDKLTRGQMAALLYRALAGVLYPAE